MKQHLTLSFIALLYFSLSGLAHADIACGYGYIESIRIDDASSDFRLVFVSQPNPNNGCVVQNATIEVRPNVDMIKDTQPVLSLALTALTTGKKVWVRYDNSNNNYVLHRLNLYRY